MSEELSVPRVFISYSHDSSDHKRWVSELATELREKGIDVILDQWDLGLGDDVPKFMERSVREADRVLVICTSNYISKFNDGVGGVGYESVVVTGELIRDLGTAKFIPIVREKTEGPHLPSALSTRFYIDLADDANRPSEVDRLLRELHQVPAVEKPPLGVNPFALTPNRRETLGTVLTPVTTEAASLPKGPMTAAEAYRRARDIAARDDQQAWRQLISVARSEAKRLRLLWTGTYLGKGPSQDRKVRVSETLEGVATFAPLMAIALAGVESGRDRYSGQLGLLEDILNPEEWAHGGLTYRVELPDAAAFVFQVLHGAMCARTGQLPIALRFLRSPIHRRDQGESVHMWRAHALMGWPASFDGDSGVAWSALAVIENEWPWVAEVFGTQGEFREAVTAYYLAVSVNEFAKTLQEGGVDSLDPERLRLETPTHFAAIREEVGRRAYRLLLQDPKDVRKIWRSVDVDDNSAVAGWPKWLKVGEHWHRGTYRFGRDYMVFAKDLVAEVVEQCRLMEE